MKRTNGASARLIMATVLAPLAGSAIVFTGFVLWIGSQQPGSMTGLSEAYGFALCLGAMIGWPAMIILGLPAHAVILLSGQRRITAYMLLGAFSGIVASIIFFVIVGHGPLSDATGFLSLIGGLTGAASAMAFYLLRGPIGPLTLPPKPATSGE